METTKVLKTSRERSIAKARPRLGDERLLSFLRSCRDTGDILACKLINDHLDKGESLDAIFFTGEESGYTFAVKAVGRNAYKVKFGYVMCDAEAGDGGEWLVTYDDKGDVQTIALEDQWIA